MRSLRPTLRARPRRPLEPVQPLTAHPKAVTDLLGPLHEASKVLARFDNVDQMLAELFSVLSHALPLRTVVLVDGRAERRRLRAWSSPGLTRSQLAHAKRRARASHDFLAGRCPSPPSIRPSPLGRGLGFVTLPLVSDDGRVFGVLQSETVGRTDEADLAFLDAVSSGLAVSLDRHHAFRHEVEQRRRAEALAIENARLFREAQEATASRERLLALVSHDLKTPLSSIALCVSALLSRAPPVERRNKGRRHLEAIARCAERMKHLVHDLVDAASIEAGQLALSRAVQPVSPILGEAMQLIQPLATEHRLDLEEECPRRGSCADARAGRCALWVSGFQGDIQGELECECSTVVNADKQRIVQVLVNLLGNAIKFSNERGRVRLAIKPEGDTVRFSVRDFGPGVEDKDLPRLFDQFWRAEATRHLGHGLGLYLCKGIVEAHGGRIWAESKKGVGSTFHFTVPSA